MNAINRVETESEIEACFQVMHQLRPHLVKREFVTRILRQKSDCYQLISIGTQDEVLGVAGFRVLESLGHGKFVYVDDLVTDEKSRSRSLGKQLFSWLLDYAKSNDCDELRLDCGVHRFDAHRFYHRGRMKISAHHFILPLK